MAETKVHCLDFNDAQDCFICGLSSGLRVYSTDPLVEKLNLDYKTVGSVDVATMLRRSNLIAIVPSDNSTVAIDNTFCDTTTPSVPYSSDTLLLWDDLKRKFVLEIKMGSKITAVKMSPKKLVVVTLKQITIFSFPGKPGKLSTVETRYNPKGLCELSADPAFEYLAFPAFRMGSVQLLDLQQLSPICSSAPVTINAHQNELACMAMNRSGTVLATASVRGTLIRLFDVQKRQLITELRRGADPATFYCITFSPDSSYMCASSDKGTIHIFCVQDLSLNKRSAFQNIGVLGGSYVDSQWALAKCAGSVESPCICGFGPGMSVVAVYHDGSYSKYVFSNDGTCKRETFERFLHVTDDQEFWDSYK